MKVGTESSPPTNEERQKIVVLVGSLFMLAAFAAMDYLQFLNGGWATLSQIWLSINKKLIISIGVSAFIFAALQQHVSQARDPGNIPDPNLWLNIALTLPFYILGHWYSYYHLYQLPNQD